MLEVDLAGTLGSCDEVLGSAVAQSTTTSKKDSHFYKFYNSGVHAWPLAVLWIGVQELGSLGRRDDGPLGEDILDTLG
jgi:hypothetical protein